MRYRTAIDMIFQEIPPPKDGRTKDNAQRAFWSAQIDANLRNHKGWPHARREGVVRFGGSVDDGTVSVTQNSRTATGTGTAFTSSMVGWRIGLLKGETEIYTIAAVASTTSITLDRPFEGDTDIVGTYRAYDAHGIMPADYHATESIVLEYGSSKPSEADFGYIRGLWPKPIGLAGIDVAMLAQPTKSARWTDTGATLTKGSASVSVTGTLPEWVVGRHIKVSGEDVLYKIASRTSDTEFVLDRVYGGDNAGSGRTLYIDPPGSFLLEVAQVQEDQFALKLQYFAKPEMHVNDSDEIEGGDDYAMMLVEMASAGLLASLPSEIVERYQTRIQTLRSNAMNKLRSLLEGKKVSDSAPVARDVRYSNRLYR